MNEFPQFHPGEPALGQLSSVRLNKISLGQKGNQIQPGTGYRVNQTSGGTTVSTVRKRIPSQQFDPLWTTMTFVDPDYQIVMQDGKVIARDNLVGDCVTTWDIDNLPTKDSPMTVADGDKVWCKVDEDDSGIVTAAKIESGSDWPESLAPVLKGGDNTSGTPGYRYYEIAEFIKEDGVLVRHQYLTGHIDHFPPTLIDNLYTSGDEIGSVLKLWNPDLGRWELRQIATPYGIKLTQSDDLIKLDFDAKNTGGADGCKVLDLPDPLAEGQAKFRQIRELNSGEAGDEGIDTQIHVTVEDGQDSPGGAADTIRVRGNTIKGSLSFFDDFLGIEVGRITWQDGLIITAGDQVININTF